HGGDEVRRVDERDSLGLQVSYGNGDVRSAKVQTRTRWFEWLLIRLFNQQTDTGAVEEDQIAEAEQLSQTQGLRIETFGRFGIINRDGDLANLVESCHGGYPFLTYFSGFFLNSS